MTVLSTNRRSNPTTESRRKSLNLSSWNATFPSDQKSEENRLSFLSRMAYIAFAQYLLYRGLIPKGVFKRRRLDEVYIYCFKTEKRWGFKLGEMMKGLKEAINKKYVKCAFVMINEDKRNPDVATEVFSLNFCYEENHSLDLVDEKGNCIVSMGYEGDKAFRTQTKHMINKLKAVTKHLTPLESASVMPFLKLTYYENTPEDYQPNYFVDCKSTYTFDKQASFYNVGQIATDATAISFDLKSVYIKPDEVPGFEDLLYKEAGYEENMPVDPANVTFASEGDFSPDGSPAILARVPRDNGKRTAIVETEEEEDEVVMETDSSERRTTGVETTHVSESIIERAREADSALMIPELGEPENLVRDDMELNEEYNAEPEQSPGHVEMPLSKKLALVNTPKYEGTRRAKSSSSKRDTKASTARRSIMKSPNDEAAYVGYSP